MTNEKIIEKVKKRMENEVWYQELRLNAKNPAFHMSEKATEIAINRKELAQSILKLINTGDNEEK